MHRRRRSRPFIASLAIVGLIAAGTFAWRSAPAGAVTVGSEAELRAALADTSEGSIQLNSDVTLTD